MRRIRRSQPRRVEPNLTPLLDMVLQLITFFMILVHFGSQIEGATPSIQLPVTASALPRADLSLDRLVIGIDSQGRLLKSDSDQTIEDADRSAWWSAEANRRREGLKLLGRPTDELPTVLVLRADRRVPYRVVRQTLAEAQRHGFARFNLVVLRNQNP
jgi:biopolymer transport protein ExbD